MDIAFVRNGSGPPPGGPRIDVLYPKAGGQVTGVITSHAAVTVFTHYDPLARGELGSSVPCIEPAKDCPHCRRNRRRIWKAFIGCWSAVSARAFLAEVTAEAARNEPRIADPRLDLRGMLLTLSRPGRNRQGRVWAKLEAWAGRVEDLPPPLNVVPYLYRLWGYTFTDPDQLGRKEGGDA